MTKHKQTNSLTKKQIAKRDSLRKLYAENAVPTENYGPAQFNREWNPNAEYNFKKFTGVTTHSVLYSGGYYVLVAQPSGLPPSQDTAAWVLVATNGGGGRGRFMGYYNAETNNPHLENGIGTDGDYYITKVPGNNTPSGEFANVNDTVACDANLNWTVGPSAENSDSLVVSNTYVPLEDTQVEIGQTLTEALGALQGQATDLAAKKANKITAAVVGRILTASADGGYMMSAVDLDLLVTTVNTNSTNITNLQTNFNNLNNEVTSLSNTVRNQGLAIDNLITVTNSLGTRTSNLETAVANLNSQMTTKQNLIAGATSGNLAAIDGAGQTFDSGVARTLLQSFNDANQLVRLTGDKAFVAIGADDVIVTDPTLNPPAGNSLKSTLAHLKQSGPGSGVTSVTGNIVNNTDPANPIVTQKQSDWDSEDPDSLSTILNKPGTADSWKDPASNELISTQGVYDALNSLETANYIYMDPIGGRVDGDGTLADPVRTFAGALNLFPAGVGTTAIYIQNSTVEDFIFRENDSNIQVILAPFTVHDGQITLLASNANIQFVAPMGAATLTGGMIDNSANSVIIDCAFPGTYSKTGGSGTSTPAGLVTFGVLSDIGGMTLSVTGNSTVRTLGVGAMQQLTMANGNVTLYHKGSVVSPVVSGGATPANGSPKLTLRGIRLVKSNVGANALTCSADNGAVIFDNVSTRQQDGSYGKIIFTNEPGQLCEISVGCDFSKVDGDNVFPTNTSYYNTADLIDADYSNPTNYTPTSSTILGHLKGINAALGSGPGGDIVIANTLFVAKNGTPEGTGLLNNPFSTIQAAINAGSAGTEIMVFSGTYDENVALKVGQVLCGAGGHNTCITGTVTLTSTASTLSTVVKDIYIKLDSGAAKPGFVFNGTTRGTLLLDNIIISIQDGVFPCFQYNNSNTFSSVMVRGDSFWSVNNPANGANVIQSGASSNGVLSLYNANLDMSAGADNTNTLIQGSLKVNMFNCICIGQIQSLNSSVIEMFSSSIRTLTVAAISVLSSIRSTLSGVNLVTGASATASTYAVMGSGSVAVINVRSTAPAARVFAPTLNGGQGIRIENTQGFSLGAMDVPLFSGSVLGGIFYDGTNLLADVNATARSKIPLTAPGGSTLAPTWLAYNNSPSFNTQVLTDVINSTGLWYGIQAAVGSGLFFSDGKINAGSLISGVPHLSKSTTGASLRLGAFIDGQAIYQFGYNDTSTTFIKFMSQPRAVAIPIMNTGATITGWQDVVFGWSSVVGLTSDGRVFQMTRTSQMLTEVTFPAGVVISSIQTSRYRTNTNAETFFAISATGVLYGWGNNNNGQLGQGNYLDTTAPVAINLGSLSGKIVTKFACSSNYGMTCAAVASDHTLHTWGAAGSGAGYNICGTGEAGNKNYNVPQLISAVGAVTDVVFGGGCVLDATGYNCVCRVLRTDGTSWATGVGSTGAIAAGDVLNTLSFVQEAMAYTDIIKIIGESNASGAVTAIIRSSDKTLRFAGTNYDYSLGTALTGAVQNTFALTPTLAAAPFQGFMDATCSLAMTGSLIGWNNTVVIDNRSTNNLSGVGANTKGELGLGTVVNQTSFISLKLPAASKVIRAYAFGRSGNDSGFILETQNAGLFSSGQNDSGTLLNQFTPGTNIPLFLNCLAY